MIATVKGAYSLQMKKSGKTLLTVTEAARLLGAGESSVRKWAKEGKFQGAKLIDSPIGSYWMIPEAALKSFVVRKPGRPRKGADAKTAPRRDKS